MTAAHRYQILAPLARGGMGEILLARRLGPAGFEKLVVLKRPLHAAGSRALVTALIEEARLLARINHPNVCQIYDLEQAGDQFFFTMEYLEGLSMWSMLGATERAGRGIEPRMVCGLFEQACDGLDAIHAMRTPDGGRIIHRDVSPGNLFVTERGIVKVLDLGIAKSSESEDHTPFGRVKGKLAYLSPEQAAGQPIDHRADLFSLGLVLHDMILVRRPTSERIGALAAGALDLAAVAPPLDDVIRCAVAARPNDRFATARDMAAALRDAASAFGGAPSHREIASWLADQFATELARRRTRADAAATPDGTATRTQILSLRSASAGSVDEIHRAMLQPRATERLDVPTRERLDMPVYDRVDSPTRYARDRSTHESIGALGHNVLDAPAPALPDLPTPERLHPTAGGEPLDRRASPRRHRAATLSVAAAAVIAIGIGAAALARTGRGRNASPTLASPTVASSTVAPPTAAPPTTPPPTAAPPTAASPTAASPTAASPTAASPTAAPSKVIAPTVASRAHKVRQTGEAASAGQLTIDSQPFAVIRIGKREIGTTPLWRLSLPPGRHELHAATADGRTQDLILRIEPGRERKVMLDWSHR